MTVGHSSDGIIIVTAGTRPDSDRVVHDPMNAFFVIQR